MAYRIIFEKGKYYPQYKKHFFWKYFSFRSALSSRWEIRSFGKLEAAQEWLEERKESGKDNKKKVVWEEEINEADL